MKKILPIIILIGWIYISCITFGIDLVKYASSGIYIIGKYEYFSDYIISFVILSILIFFSTLWIINKKTIILNTVLLCIMTTLIVGFTYKKFNVPYYEHTITINNETNKNTNIEIIPGIKGEVIIKTRISANSKFSFPIYTTFKGKEGKNIISINQIIDKDKIKTLMSNKIEDILLEANNDTNLYIRD